MAMAEPMKASETWYAEAKPSEAHVSSERSHSFMSSAAKRTTFVTTAEASAILSSRSSRYGLTPSIVRVYTSERTRPTSVRFMMVWWGMSSTNPVSAILRSSSITSQKHQAGS